jgi:hypothetical protein
MGGLNGPHFRLDYGGLFSPYAAALIAAARLLHLPHARHEDCAMPPLPAVQTFISVDEYINGELRSEIRHEYVDGQVYAMGGASRAPMA